MAKINRIGGFTDATVRGLLPAVAEVVRADTEPEKEEPSPGNSSETSPVKPPKRTAKRAPAPKVPDIEE